jgi:hypothetical protein
VQVLEAFTGAVLAEHALVAPGETSIVDEHYGSTRPDKPRRAPRAKTTTEKQIVLVRCSSVGDMVARCACGELLVCID